MGVLLFNHVYEEYLMTCRIQWKKGDSWLISVEHFTNILLYFSLLIGKNACVCVKTICDLVSWILYFKYIMMLFYLSKVSE